jgi:hypothetical protein
LSDAFLFLIRSENADHLDWFLMQYGYH